MNWIIEQVWEHVLFLHWRMNAQSIQHLVPFELDLFEGDAVISVVPFQMNQIRFPFFPKVPFVSSLWELNLRTYVKVNGVRGVYFFTLDTDSALGTFIANRFFHLPYRLAQMQGRVVNQNYTFSSVRSDLSFKMSAQVSGVLKTKTKLDSWATDREHLFTKTAKHIYRGTVIHEAWRLQGVSALTFEDRFTSQINIQVKNPPDAVSYCERLKVRFKPFEIV